jgi:hemoglobin-like flavoprotein
MTPEQKRNVQHTFAQLTPLAAANVAELFYLRLFQLDPDVKVLFRGDLEVQGRKLMQMLGVAVQCLDDMEQLVPTVQDLGRRHAGYGVQDHHYATVGEALLWTLEKTLGSDFTPETRAAWATVYTFIATLMKEAITHVATTT